MENDIQYQELGDEELALVAGGTGHHVNNLQINQFWNRQLASAKGGLAAVAFNVNVGPQVNVIALANVVKST